MATCSAPKRDGTPCTTPVVGDGRKCWAHDPAMAEKRAEKRRLGGQNRSTAKRLSKIMPVRLVPVWDQLEQALADVLSGDLDPRQATAAAAVARALAVILQAGEVEERIRALEAQQPPSEQAGRRYPWQA